MSKDTNLIRSNNRRPPQGKGRPKGAPNKVTKALKDMILGALDGAGGEAYLQRQADENPAAFMTLIGKVLPTTLAGDKDAPLIVKIERVIVDHAED